MSRPAPPHRTWQARDFDRAFLALLGANLLLAFGLGHRYGQWQPALQLGLACLVPGAVGAYFWRGTLGSRLLLSTSLVALVALQIHLSAGQLLWHFNVFVSLSLLLVYRDPKTIGYTAGLFIGHHLLFDRLLAAGFGTFCLNAPDLLAVSFHAAFVAAQGLALAAVARVQQREWLETRELEFLVRAMGDDGPIRLNLEVLRADTAAGQRLKQVQQRMADAMRQVRQAEASVHSAAEQVAAGSAELLNRTQTTAEGLKNAAICMEQICVIVNHSTEASNEAQRMSEQAATMADEGGALVADVVRTMQDIETSSRRIGDIVGVIDGIAFQTNILALNAAVEAARAGEQGRGFAVVAGEVRSLAQRSAEAAREIKALVGQSSSTVERGTALVNGAGQSMQSLVAAVRRVGELFDGVTKDTAEHTQGLEMVTQSINQLGEITQHNLAVADSSGAAAQALQHQTARLGEVMRAFRLGGSGDQAAAAPVPAPAAVAAPAPKPAPRAAAAAASSGTVSKGVEFF